MTVFYIVHGILCYWSMQFKFLYDGMFCNITLFYIEHAVLY